MIRPAVFTAGRFFIALYFIRISVTLALGVSFFHFVIQPFPNLLQMKYIRFFVATIALLAALASCDLMNKEEEATLDTSVRELSFTP